MVEKSTERDDKEGLRGRVRALRGAENCLSFLLAEGKRVMDDTKEGAKEWVDLLSVAKEQ